MRDDAGAALAAAAAVGPFSTVDAEPGADWVTWAALVQDPAVLSRRVEEVRRFLAAGPGSPNVPARVAASIAQLGLVARLLAPPLGAALVTGVLPVATPSAVHLRPAGSNPLPMALPAATAVRTAGPAELAAAVAEHWLLPMVAPLTEAVRREHRLSPRVLDGNAASAAAGALATATRARPDLGPAAAALLNELLTGGPLAGTGRIRPDGTFLRNSCCLFYRVPGAGTCGDCVLGVRR